MIWRPDTASNGGIFLLGISPNVAMRTFSTIAEAGVSLATLSRIEDLSDGNSCGAEFFLTQTCAIGASPQSDAAACQGRAVVAGQG
jgi:hypothetical protein